MTGARLLRQRDAERVHRILGEHPVESVLVGSRVRHGLINRASMGGSLWGHRDALCFSGANLIPVNATDDDCDAFAELALSEGQRCSSIVGRTPAIERLWQRLEPHWGPPRVIRWRQPVMTIERTPSIAPDPRVRLASIDDFDQLLGASVEMYIEEIGVSPMRWDGGTSYRKRLRGLIRDRVSYVRVDDGRVVFKAELGAVTSRCAQLQGVWVPPDLRGQGLAAQGTAAVVEAALASGVPEVCLTVNDFNLAARAAYARVGFVDVDQVTTILF